MEFPSTQDRNALQQVTGYFSTHGCSLVQAHDHAIQWIGAQVQAQASFLSYMDAFWVLMLNSHSVVPLAFALRKSNWAGQLTSAIEKFARRPH